MTAAETMPHVPVLADESLEWLRAGPGKLIIDGTFGAGGHTRLLLDSGADVLAIDQDPAAAETARHIEAEYGTDRFRFSQGNFRELDRILAEARGDSGGFDRSDADGVLLDIGVSSMQIDEADRGFAFRQDGPLDMRMSSHGPTAADVVNDSEEAELAAIIYRYGEERHSRRIARAIKKEADVEPITDTARLASVIQAAYPGGQRRDHPARRTFQALRIHVNDELGALEDALRLAPSVLAPAGRLVVLSYHSLEDRIVKHALREDARFEVLTKRPLQASSEEQAANPRARSAKLRAAERRAE